jgi:hypothetical protein
MAEAFAAQGLPAEHDGEGVIGPVLGPVGVLVLVSTAEVVGVEVDTGADVVGELAADAADVDVVVAPAGVLVAGYDEAQAQRAEADVKRARPVLTPQPLITQLRAAEDMAAN